MRPFGEKELKLRASACPRQERDEDCPDVPQQPRRVPLEQRNSQSPQGADIQLYMQAHQGPCVASARQIGRRLARHAGLQDRTLQLIGERFLPSRQKPSYPHTAFTQLLGHSIGASDPLARKN